MIKPPSSSKTAEKTTINYAKQIADELELSKNLTTYTARHSHAYALLMGGASLEVIMDQFKHSSMKTTMSYIDSIDNEKRKDIAKLLWVESTGETV